MDQIRDPGKKGVLNIREILHYKKRAKQDLPEGMICDLRQGMSVVSRNRMKEIADEMHPLCITSSQGCTAGAAVRASEVISGQIRAKCGYLHRVGKEDLHEAM